MTDVEGGSGERDFTETTTQSYGSKMKDACSGVCVAFLLFFGSIALLVFNEGRTVRRARDLGEGRDNVLILDLSNFTSAIIPTSFEDKLIHTVGDLSTEYILTDPTFGVSSGKTITATENTNGTSSTNSSSLSPKENQLLKLRRSVEMFQWVESSRDTTTSNADGSTTTTTTYTYNKQWSSLRIDSSLFKEASPVNRTNPMIPFEPLSLTAEPILLGDRLLLTESVVGYLSWFEPLTTVALTDVPDVALRSRLRNYNSNGFFYHGTSNTSIASDPIVGDTRITFEAVPSDTISVIAKLNAPRGDGRNSIDAFATSRGGSLLLVHQGRKTSEEMFAQAEAENTVIAWVLRFVGFFLMMISIQMFLQPIATAVDIIPFIGDCMKGGMEGCIFPLIALIIALPISLFVIALSWLAYRPFIAIPICAVSLGFMIWLRLRHKHVTENNPNSNAAAAFPTPAAMAPPPMVLNQAPPPSSGNPEPYNNGSNYGTPPGDGGGFASALDNNNPPATAPSYHGEGDVAYNK